MIEPLIRQSIMKSEAAAQLTTYNGEKAVFYQLAPNDVDPLWDSKQQYPRIDYYADWSYNAERKTSGQLEVNVWCLGESGIAPEDIASALSKELSETFFNDGKDIVCAVWNNSNSFESGEKEEPRIYGVTINFDLLAFPKQTTGLKPDAVEGMNKYLKRLIGAAYMLGYDELPEVFKASDEKPAVYVRLASNVADMQRVYAVAWFDCTLSVHLIAPDPNIREFLLTRLAHKMALDGECLLTETSPLLFKRNITVNFGTNPLFDGQMSVPARYGVLNYDDDWDAPLLNHIHRKVVQD